MGVLLVLIAPFLIGLLVGAIVKKAFSLIILGAVLVIVLIATGAIGLTYGELFNEALDFLPKLWSGAQGWLGILPYSSIGFLIGLALGLWKG
ncbi:hypothetical protein AKJ37_07225 [candidate division MSBL1 archaeon SCGC-AAA259I09]|uniref:FUN14 family protein n=6 Tax=candidate division MSBL1 TaxID=215777 RepID=A0A133UQT3_9EURY|nr:hypothetical protein AKJ57_06790 [candidate division MSBL1 archaeon SCGC-AAA259A05]KXA90419.1 hypothetical protein AKJ62_00990 [candidate division MSBL1 archaeon SCGC-AAA259D14]KXA92292.1 hypothetical protein AKJ66_04400 [candidate division MSBL1 archaeon SCGC-AAA259E22]KXA94886.1 hypothetical protein AKJ37_07225 [candidate division MSBL1 archaeon SCGC-AAA259I09]KXA96604.1 hypothetical protein AKJ38_03000 [candidate division MSBL1 archaeon SCGC-AAA259I14]KXA99781.1 hypothetical protein AKJ4